MSAISEHGPSHAETMFRDHHNHDDDSSHATLEDSAFASRTVSAFPGRASGSTGREDDTGTTGGENDADPAGSATSGTHRHHGSSSSSTREDSAFGMFGPSYGQPGYGQSGGMNGQSGGMTGGRSGGMFGRNQPMGPTIFLVPTRGVGSCSGNSAPNMVQLPSMYSMGPTLLTSIELIKRQMRFNSFF